jgi:AraC-like DNA-binding protein
MPYFDLRRDDLDPGNEHFSPDEVARPIVAFSGDMITKGTELAFHSHRRAQLVLTLRGIVRCEAAQGVWIVPPRCAVWIPDGLSHSVTLAGNIKVCCLFVDPDARPSLPGQCCTISVSPLLQQLLLHAAQMPALYDTDGPDGRIAAVLLDQLCAAPVEKLSFPMPTHPKLRQIAAAMMSRPDDRATINDWSQRVGVAPRTLTRMLYRETGMSFGRWRQQLHILIALKRLTQGASVQNVALELGYENASAFVTMFRKALGKPPARYLAELHMTA